MSKRAFSRINEQREISRAERARRRAQARASVSAVLVRRIEAAAILACSESQVLKFEREGTLQRIDVPGIRAVRYAAAEVQALAASWIDSAKQA